jgi:tetratricopeptide (TPR) repeat protein
MDRRRCDAASRDTAREHPCGVPPREVTMRTGYLLLPLLALTACAPKRIHEPPIIRTGDRVTGADAAVEAARQDAARTDRETTGRRDELTAQALATCTPDVCAAVTRGELMVGMSEVQVLAATRTTEAAWRARDAGAATIMVPAARSLPPRDAAGEVGMVQLQSGRVTAYAYNEAQGARLVTAPAEAATAGRAAQLADMLLREGDDLAARGQLDLALDRYDRAHILHPISPDIEYRIATVLDKQLRPIEALIRYRLFLHQLELERIRATGEAYGHLAGAIAHARERVVILERQTR